MSGEVKRSGWSIKGSRLLRLLISNPSFPHIHTHLVKSNSLISFPIVVPRHDKLRRGWGRRGNKNENSCYATRWGKIGARIPFSFWDSGGRWLANDNAIWFHPFADFHPLAFPIVPVVRRTGSKNLAGSPRGRRGEGRERDFIVGQFIPHSALRPIRWILFLGGAWPGRASNRFLLRPLIRRGPVPSCKASWFRSIEHANAPQFVPDAPMTLHAPFIFYVFRVLYFSSHHFMRVYMELIRQRADVELKLEREREKEGGRKKLFKFKEEGTCQLFSARERE